MGALELTACNTTPMPGPREALQAAVVAKPLLLLNLTVSRGFGTGKPLVLSMAAVTFKPEDQANQNRNRRSHTRDPFQILLLGHREIEPELASLVRSREVESSAAMSDMMSHDGNTELVVIHGSTSSGSDGHSDISSITGVAGEYGGDMGSVVDLNLRETGYMEVKEAAK